MNTIQNRCDALGNCKPQLHFTFASEGSFALQPGQVITFKGSRVAPLFQSPLKVESVLEERDGLPIRCRLSDQEGGSFWYETQLGYIDRNFLHEGHKVMLLAGVPTDTTVTTSQAAQAKKTEEIACRYVGHLPVFENLLYIVSKAAVSDGFVRAAIIDKELASDRFVRLAIDTIIALLYNLRRLGVARIAELLQDAEGRPASQKNIVAQAFEMLVRFKNTIEEKAAAKEKIDYEQLDQFVVGVEKARNKERRKSEISGVISRVIPDKALIELMASYIDVNELDPQEMQKLAEKADAVEALRQGIEDLQLQSKDGIKQIKEVFCQVIERYVFGWAPAITVPQAMQGQLAAITELDDLNFVLQRQKDGDRLCAALQFLATHCPNLQRLNLEDVSNLDDRALVEVGRMRALKTLSLAECKALTDAGLVSLKGLVQLEKLDLRACSFNGAGFGAFSAMQGLHSLDAHACQNLCRYAAMPHFKKLLGLHSISVDGNFHKEEAAQLQAALPKLKHVGYPARLSDASDSD